MKPKDTAAGAATLPNSWIEDYLITFLRNARVTFKNVHIRFEDDYFCKSFPFAFGLLCEQLTAYTSNKSWKFGSLDQEQFVSTPMPPSPTAFIKELTALGAKLYFEPNAEMIIPRRLWEDTIDAEGYVFSKMSLAQYVTSMNKAAAGVLPENFLLSKANIYISSMITHGGSYSLKTDILVTSAAVNLSPELAGSLVQLKEFTENYYLSFQLKGYRPARRVLTRMKKSTDSAEYLRKRKLLVRDWFFFIVWYVRLKKTLSALGAKGLENEVHPAGNFRKFVDLFKGNCRVTLRCQDISLNIWNDPDKEKRIVRDKAAVPNVKIFLRNPAMEYYISADKEGFQGLVKDFVVTQYYLKEPDSPLSDSPMNDSPIRVSKIPETIPAVFQNVAETAAAAATPFAMAGKIESRGPITRSQTKALEPPKIDAALMSLVGPTAGIIEQPGARTQPHSQFRKAPEFTPTTAAAISERHSLCPETIPLVRKGEEKKFQRVTEFTDEASRHKAQSAVVFQIGSGYTKEGVARISFTKSQEQIVGFLKSDNEKYIEIRGQNSRCSGCFE